MKKIIDFGKKYKVHILTTLMFFFMIRSCTKSTQIKKLGRVQGNAISIIDSLQSVIGDKQNKIDSFPERLRIEKINIHLEYDSWISSKNRGQQLMELHSVVKNNIKELQKN
jgi:hypothetical protein